MSKGRTMVVTSRLKAENAHFAQSGLAYTRESNAHARSRVGRA